MKLLIPSNLNIDKIIQENRTIYVKYSLKRDDLLFFCSCLLKERAKQRKRMLEENTRFTNLCSSYLQIFNRNYTIHFDFLISAGIMISDNHFKEGEKCTGYCFTDKYLGSRIKEVEVVNYRLKRAIRRTALKLSTIDKKNTWGYSYLTKWLDSQKLDIDLKKADLWIDNYTEAKLNSIKKNPKLRKRNEKIQNAIVTARDFKNLTKMIKFSEIKYKFSGVGHRFYSPMTYLKRELRNFLTFEGQNLVSIDLKNSQPYLSLILFKKDFWENEKKQGFGIRMLEDIYNKLRITRQYKNLITLVNSPQILASKELGFEKYKSSVISGQFYEDIQAEFEPLYPERFNKRDKVKKEVMRILYSDPEKHYAKFYKPCQTFYKQFPLVYEVFNLIKKNNYTYLPLILQRIESYLVIDVICKRISYSKPEIPLFTIHDSIVTTKGNEGFVEAVMAEEFGKLIGHVPILDIQYLIS